MKDFGLDLFINALKWRKAIGSNLNREVELYLLVSCNRDLLGLCIDNSKDRVSQVVSSDKARLRMDGCNAYCSWACLLIELDGLVNKLFWVRDVLFGFFGGQFLHDTDKFLGIETRVDTWISPSSDSIGDNQKLLGSPKRVFSSFGFFLGMGQNGPSRLETVSGSFGCIADEVWWQVQKSIHVVIVYYWD